MSLFTGKYLSWGQLVLETAGAVDVEVIDCYSDNYTMISAYSTFPDWLFSISLLNTWLCTEADVHVKYRYKYENEYYIAEEKYHVRKYEWSGWRIEEGY